MRRKTGYVQRRGDSWRIAYYVEGTRHFETHPDEETARRELAKRLAEIADGIPVSSKPNTVLFGELCADVITDYQVNAHRSIDDIEARFRLHIVPALGDKRACQITTADIKRYIERRLLKGAKPGTVNRELEAIKRAFLLAIEGKKLNVRPVFKLLKENNARQGFFTREEVDKLCSFLKEPHRSIVLFGFLTGWRLSEIVGLRWDQVDFAAGEIRLWSINKTDEPRVFTMTTELRALLKVRAVATSKETIPKNVMRVEAVRMPAFAAQKVFGNNLSFYKRWATACRKAGFCIPSINEKPAMVTRTFHDLRRSAAREMENQGVPRSVIKDLMGHKTDAMFTRYRIVSASDKKAAAEIIDRARNGANSSKSDSSVQPSIRTANSSDTSTKRKRK